MTEIRSFLLLSHSFTLFLYTFYPHHMCLPNKNNLINLNMRTRKEKKRRKEEAPIKERKRKDLKRKKSESENNVCPSHLRLRQARKRRFKRVYWETENEGKDKKRQKWSRSAAAAASVKVSTWAKKAQQSKALKNRRAKLVILKKIKNFFAGESQTRCALSLALKKRRFTIEHCKNDINDEKWTVKAMLMITIILWEEDN